MGHRLASALAPQLRPRPRRPRRLPQGRRVAVLVLRLRASRRRARTLAIAEAHALLRDLDADVPNGGPFGDERGVAWIEVPEHHLDEAIDRLPRLGYTVAVDVMAPAGRVERVYDEDRDRARDAAVDRRPFRIRTDVGVRVVRGYRGSGGALTRRGLAVADARLLANLAAPVGGGLVLDPFGGAGGVVIEIGASASCVSVDVDPTVALGLADLSGRHVTASAAHLPFSPDAFDGVATETPFDASADGMVAAAFAELIRCMRRGARLALMAPERQVRQLRTTARRHGLTTIVDHPVDRRGVAVTVVSFQIGAIDVAAARPGVSGRPWR